MVDDAERCRYSCGHLVISPLLAQPEIPLGALANVGRMDVDVGAHPEQEGVEVAIELVEVGQELGPSSGRHLRLDAPEFGRSAGDVNE